MTGAMLLPRTRSRDHGDCDPVARAAALDLGLKPAAVHQLLFGRGRVNLRVAILITHFKRLGEEQRLARWLAPIEAALRGILAPTDSAALAVQAQTADADEDVVEIAYLTHPCHETAKQLVRAIDTERALQLERRQALAARWQLT